ncbi:MAG TPA: ABC transporter permease [Anaerolineales bacterium]|nr:ABC transporter permease [Anaerolineales bacterium]
MAVATVDKKVVETLAAEAMPEEESQLKIVARRFMRHKMAVISLTFLLFVFTASLFVKQIAPYGSTELELGNTFALPGTASPESGKIHYLGTDHLGRDYFSRILYAARITLTVAFTTVIGSVVIGATFGAVSGYYGGIVDDVSMRLVEFMLTIPDLPILLILSSILLQKPDILPIPDVVVNAAAALMYVSEREALQVLMVSLVLMSFGWLGVARLMRGMALSIKTQDFVEASRALGVSSFNIIARHLIPNALAPIIVSASLALAGYIITEAILSFLGFGIQDPTPTWGNMLGFAQSYMFQHPWLPLIPGLPMFICVLAFNFVGDGLRDALDPRLKR